MKTPKVVSQNMSDKEHGHALPPHPGPLPQGEGEMDRRGKRIATVQVRPKQSQPGERQRFLLASVLTFSLMAWVWSVRGQAPQVLSARQIGGAGTDKAASVTTDLAGNVYITGAFSAEADFGGYTLSTSNQHSDLFLAKYSPSGALLWA